MLKHPQSRDLFTALTPLPSTEPSSQWCPTNISQIIINMNKHTQNYNHFLGNAFPTNILQSNFWAEGNVLKLAHQDSENELKLCTVDLQKHIDFINFELRISLGTWEEAETWACWFFRDPASQQLLYLNTTAFFAIFLGKPWQCAVRVSYQLPGGGNVPSHFKQGSGAGEGTPEKWNPGCACWG